MQPRETRQAAPAGAEPPAPARAEAPPGWRRPARVVLITSVVAVGCAILCPPVMTRMTKDDLLLAFVLLALFALVFAGMLTALIGGLIALRRARRAAVKPTPLQRVGLSLATSLTCLLIGAMGVYALLVCAVALGGR